MNRTLAQGHTHVSTPHTMFEACYEHRRQPLMSLIRLLTTLYNSNADTVDTDEIYEDRLLLYELELSSILHFMSDNLVRLPCALRFLRNSRCHPLSKLPHR